MSRMQDRARMRRTVCLGLVTLAALVALAEIAPASAQGIGPKVGVFDAQRITQETAEGARIQARLTALQEKKRGELEKLQAELKKLQDDFMSTAVSMSEDKRREMNLRIDRKQIELEGVQKSASREMQLEAEQAQEAWQGQVLAAVNRFGKERGFTLILPVDVVPYFDRAIDVTEELIKLIDVTKPAPAAAAPAPPKK